jgi:hypothetical protein
MENKLRNKNKCFKLWGFVTVFLMILASAFFVNKSSDAAELSLSIKEINYLNSTITLQLNSSDTAVYFSDSAKKKWETIPGQISSSKTITMDISWISVSSSYVLSFKGNYSEKVISVTIPKQVTNFKASFNKLKGIVTFSNSGNRTIEWRKKGSSTWKTLDPAAHPAEVSRYFNDGAQLCYRLAPVNGTGSGSPGLRASSEVTLTIPKKTTAPNITINGSKFTIPAKKGMAYRKINSDGTITDWTTITATTDLLISNIAPEVLYTGSASGQKEATLQFRTNASTSSQVSNITTVTIPVQKGAPDEDTYGITLNYTSSTSLSLTVKAATTATPFEYTIVARDRVLNYLSATWKTISSGSAVSISSTAAPVGSHIYVRMKSTEASGKTNLASVEKEIIGTNGIEYPDVPQVTQLTTLISTAGICRTGVTSSYLTFYLYSPTSTTVSSIDFYDAYGNKKGSVPCRSSVTSNTKYTGANDRYLITTRITSTAEIDTLTEELLYANITLANQEVIESTASTGVILYLYPKTVINNPDTSGYSTNFKRIYLSNDTKDASSFKFQLDFGTGKVPDPSGINKFTSDATAIRSILYNGSVLIEGRDYSVEYGSYLTEDKTDITTATVTVNAASLEKTISVKTLDQSLPLTINLNNGEVINNGVNITLISTAIIDDIPIAWSITEGSLTEKTTSTTKEEDGSTSTTTQEVITFTISLTLFDSSYEVSVANVTWGDASIFSSASISKGKATIYLSNAKINKLSTDSSDTKNIVITLSNGYVIDSGCKLTILNAD